VRIVWVKAGKLLPVDSGGKIRSHNLLRHLAQKHPVTLLTYYGGSRDENYAAAIDKEFPGAVTIHTPAADGDGLKQAVHYLRHLRHHAPYSVSKFTDREVTRTVKRFFDEQSCDVAVCDFLSASLNFPSHLSIPSVLFQHNVESKLWERIAVTETSPVRKLAYQIEARKMRRYETAALRRFRHVIAVSDQDREQMLAMEPTCDISVVPTGVDTKQFAISPPTSGTPPRVAFVGTMDWEPNIDAAEYFCKEIWPRIKKAYPDAKFQLIGRSPHTRVRRLATESITVTGTVPSVTDFLRDATVIVVPLRVGGGTRLKIYEAMAMGKAVVSTTIGAEGLNVQSGRDLILADEPVAFADSVLALLRDAELRRRYEVAAAASASRFDWARISERFNDILLQIWQITSKQSPVVTS
jgi:glycosyltransferase involved in cell wall biosynthesis